jgi:hypothetical protein
MDVRKGPASRVFNGLSLKDTVANYSIQPKSAASLIH